MVAAATYHTMHKNDSQVLVHFFTRNGQALLAMVELNEHSKPAVNELIDPASREAGPTSERCCGSRRRGWPGRRTRPSNADYQSQESNTKRLVVLGANSVAVVEILQTRRCANSRILSTTRTRLTRNSHQK